MIIAKLRFQNVFRPNSHSLKIVCEKPRFRNGLVWMVRRPNIRNNILIPLTGVYIS